MKALPAARRKKIEARAHELIAEEMTLQEVRHARKLTQEQLAKSLGIKQKQISAIEKRTDMHISTLRRALEAMGGSLTLVVEFPDREPVTLTGIATTEPDPPPPTSGHRRTRAVRA
jgi:transcriptional regulator with XRE-family HTH domain